MGQSNYYSVLTNHCCHHYNVMGNVLIMFVVAIEKSYNGYVFFSDNH